ncbi:MAG: hypothetical protein KAF40_00310 [Flavihumibacter sp.]|jgi:hypothetical protein|nr:hypothetical protein [Flavihumibacter sp.]
MENNTTYFRKVIIPDFLKINPDGTWILIKDNPARDGFLDFSITRSDDFDRLVILKSSGHWIQTTREEFEKVYGIAQWQLSKTNIHQ